MSPNNFAAVLPVAQGTITVGPVDYPTLPPGGVILRNTVVAFNPVDWKIARNGNRPIEYPAVLGYSYGGVVEAVDEAVSRVKKGDYVFTQNPKAGGFQRFSAADAKFVGKVDDKSVEEAAAVVLNLRTIIGAAVEAGLDRPKDTKVANPSNGKKALVYGGSSSLGALAIQYLVQAGYTVISTSSPANHALVSGFRAAAVVDHTQSADDVVAALKQHGPYDFAFDAISTPPATAINAGVLGAQSGGIVLYSVGPPPADVDIPKNVTRVNKAWPGALAALDPSFDEWVFVKYIPEAVAAGTLKSVPLELVHGGLGAVDEALRKLEKGVSARKLILYQWEDAPKDEL
ncbi:putative alcohol dehydrogenase [Stipitochalara longipes BDJ]|nr:putative alcohol dehydrogenase [Stipitochalara longipes BDJ]